MPVARRSFETLTRRIIMFEALIVVISKLSNITFLELWMSITHSKGQELPSMKLVLSGIEEFNSALETNGISRGGASTSLSSLMSSTYMTSSSLHIASCLGFKSRANGRGWLKLSKVTIFQHSLAGFSFDVASTMGNFKFALGVQLCVATTKET